MKWRFKKIESGEYEQAPIEREFFTGKGNKCNILVREAIQNSLDARLKEDEVVKVKFRMGTVKYGDIKEYFRGFSEHLKAVRDEIRKKVGEDPFEGYKEKDDMDVHYIIVEDFGTTGLTGRVSKVGEKAPEVGESNFYDFVYRTGYSGKGEKKAGRWGIGKSAFNEISKIRTIFGVTYREDDKEVAFFGKTLLLPHTISGERWDYIGIFDDDKSTIQNREYINKFADVFKLNERTKYPGLSIVIPYYKYIWDEEDEIQLDSIKKEVIKEFFYTILTGNLEVEIVDKDRCIRLTRENVISEMKKTDHCIDEEIESEEGGKQYFVRFFEEVEEVKKNNEHILLKVSNRYQIDEETFENIDDLKDDFLNGKLLSFRITISIPFRRMNKDVENKETYFDVYIKKIEGFKEPHRFWYRSGIRVKNERYNRRLGSRGLGLLTVEDPCMSSFLGDAETPAHDEWEPAEEKIKSKYGRGAEDIVKFVKGIFGEISKILDAPKKGRDWNFLSDIFYLKVEEGEELEESSQERKVSKPQIPDEVNRKLELVEVWKNNNGGFTVGLTSKIREIAPPFLGLYFPFTLRILTAYDTIGGNPFKKYETNKPYDFDFSKDTQFRIVQKGCEIKRFEKNIIELKVLDNSFYFNIEGFDKNRDLVVNLKVEEK